MNAPLFLFDLDGTLVNSAPDLALAANLTRQQEGLEFLPSTQLEAVASQGVNALIQTAFQTTPEDPAFQMRRIRFLDNYKRIGHRHTRPYPQIEELLHRLRDNQFRVGIVTNKLEDLARRLVKNVFRDPSFLLVIGSDHKNCMMKPSPTMLWTAMLRASSPPALTLYAGDDPRDVKAAHAAGIRCAACTWGYGPKPYTSWNADYIAQRPLQLLDWALFYQRGHNLELAHLYQNTL